MHPYDFDSQGDERTEHDPAPSGPAHQPPPPRKSHYVYSPEPPKAPKEDGARRSERGAALALGALALVLAGTAVLAALRVGPVDLSAWAAAPAAPGFSIQEPALSYPAELERYPNGDGTALTLTARPRAEPMRLQEIYQKVIPSVVAIRTLLPRGVAQGTGVVMSESGYIITNAHVIEGGFQVSVSLWDGRSLEAKLVGSDSATDLAVLKVDADNLIPAVFGDSEDMVVGDTVVAIGNPMGEELRGTMTDGILSAINRDMDVDGNSMSLLQTTAALNTGNSGGALVNDQGQVIGITNMKLVSSNAYTNTLEGLGFAIPTATVKPVVDALVENGHVTGRPALGVTVRGMDEEEKTQRKVDHGILVVSVVEGSDAWGKLKAGDLLLTADGAELNTPDDLLQVKAEERLRVGDSIRFQVDRGGEPLEISVELMEQFDLEH